MESQEGRTSGMEANGREAPCPLGAAKELPERGDLSHLNEIASADNKQH